MRCGKWYMGHYLIFQIHFENTLFSRRAKVLIKMCFLWSSNQRWICVDVLTGCSCQPGSQVIPFGYFWPCAKISRRKCTYIFNAHPADTPPFPVGEAVFEERRVRKKISNSSQLNKLTDFMCKRLWVFFLKKAPLYCAYYFSVWQNVISKNSINLPQEAT